MRRIGVSLQGVALKAYEIGEQKGLASLRRADRAQPQVGPGQALLRVKAACLNHRDLKVLEGSYGPRRAESRIPTGDGVGEVVAVGGDVVSIGVGQRAVCPHFVSWLGGAFKSSVFAADLGVTLDGWLAERIVVPASALVPVPDALSDAQAAPLAAAGVTAWNALVHAARVRPGDLVLVLGTGGVSIMALQLARLHGARVAITSSSNAKLQRARELGAEITINYVEQPDWPTVLLAANGGVGADVVLETGGLGTLSGSIAAAAPNAHVVLIGALAGAGGPLPNFSSIVGKNLTLRGITEGSRAMLEELVRAVTAASMVPVIDREFGFDDADAAYRHLASGSHFGKVLIRC